MHVPTDLPWHRVPVAWLALAIPLLTVAGCMLTIYLAISNPHTVLPPADAATSSARR